MKSQLLLIMITKDNFERLPSDTNGNPRYYLPVYLTSTAKARKAYGVKYRGKKYGPGWVFSSYSLQAEVIDTLNASDTH